MTPELCCDYTMWMYAITASTSAYGLCLFIWWWAKSGDASTMFAYITMLFAGGLWETVIEAYSRGLKLTGHLELYNHILYDSLWWPSRCLLRNAILLAIMVHMTFRVVRSCRARKCK